MNIKGEITLVVEKHWVNDIEDISPGETITISLKCQPKAGTLVFVTDNDLNYITYYKQGLNGNIYPILLIRSGR